MTAAAAAAVLSLCHCLLGLRSSLPISWGEFDRQPVHAAVLSHSGRACPTPPSLRSKVVRKGIARVLTVVNQKTRDALKEAYKGKVRGGSVVGSAGFALLLQLLCCCCR